MHTVPEERMCLRVFGLSGALLSLLLCGFDPVPAPSALLPFHEGEELTFEVQWLGMPVGMATLRVETPRHVYGNDIVPLISHVRTSPFFSTFYKVDDRAESHFDVRQRVSRFYRMQQHEGRYRHQREIVFEQEQQRVAYRKNHQPPQTFPTMATAQDPLSSLYVLRTLPLGVGTSISLPIFERGKTWVTEIRVLKRERLKLPWGTSDTLKLQPMLHTAGVLKRDGELFIWLTDDARRIPVQMQSNIAIGALHARLQRAKGVQ
jgi:hypothetical protein